MNKKLSPTQQAAMDAINKHGSLIRRPGGYWTSEDTPLNHEGVPDWNFGTNTIYALINRKLVRVVKRMKRGDAYPEEVK